MDEKKDLKLGCGLGLRSTHYPVITSEWPQVDWFEAITENYMDTGGRPRQILEKVRSRYPIALHGVALSIGSADPLNQKYLERLKALVAHIEPVIVSDHLCWSGVSGNPLHDLLPLPFTEESIRHVVSRVNQVQDFLGRQILLENVSTYVTYRHSVIPEWEFLAEIAKRSGCSILLDLNNIYVNSRNHQFDPITYLNHIPAEKVKQFHLAGHTDMGTYLFDTHSRPIIEEVWNLYREALKRYGQVATLIEWDDDIPEFPRLQEECLKAKAIYVEFAGHVPVSFQESSKPQETVSQNIPTRPSGKSLAEIQEWMRLKIQPSELGKNSDTETLLNPQGGESGVERMAVYAGGYTARIYESLNEVYEAVHAVLGHDLFYQLSEAYAHYYPSEDYNLNVAGRRFPQFLEKLKDLEKFPYLTDLAKLEWKIAEAFHAFDRPALAPSQLAEIPAEAWENIKLEFQPSVSLFYSAWPVLDLWKRRHEAPSDENIQPKEEYLLISRREVRVRCEILGKAQYRLLQDFAAGKTLGEACETLMDMDENEDFPVTEWFSRWVQEGIIAACACSDEKILIGKTIETPVLDECSRTSAAAGIRPASSSIGND